MSRRFSHAAVSGRAVAAVTLLLALLLAACGTPEPGTAALSTPSPTLQAPGSDPTPDIATNPPRNRALTIEDGFIPEGAWLSAFDTDHPAIANLSPALRAAIQQAVTDAAAEGVVIVITSAWRSAHYQESLLSEAIALYGSVDEARKWVNTPERSTHVTGDAVDTGPWDANVWLGQWGYLYGLCQIYANEPWHFELIVAPGEHCPEPAVDASVG